MEVEAYSFGRIRIGGKDYTNDVIVGANFIKPDWWRKEGHRVVLEDIEDIIKAEPEIVIFGTGANGRVKVDRHVVEALRDLGAEVVISESGKAVELYNKLLRSGKRVLLAVHLTC
ncbi:Mth938-like domain-containing protein [Archaeoglobus neptunius]|uniref:Mth938-like domain-containing protein n=1 Tax=Archaeoglobus neptunius TaxID=2798580 RepID=UPI0019268156|nr:MTH938/NDUFAF3 family protein [Archaeoglobus neptunius]